MKLSSMPSKVQSSRFKVQGPKSRIDSHSPVVSRPSSFVKKLNVLQMTDITGRGGAEKALVDLALRLDRGRYRVAVCATRTAGNYQPLLDAAGVRSYILERNTKWDAYKLARLVHLLKRVDILHTHLFGSNTWGRILGRLAGVPVIISHEHWSSKGRSEVWVDRLLYRLSDRILVPSEASKRTVMELEGIPSRHISVVYNGVDIKQFAPSDTRERARRELGVEQDDVLIGTVGRLSPEKGGVDFMIAATARLRERRPEARLVIVGDGPLRAGLERLAGSLGSNAIFTGTRSDVAQLLGAMDIFVLPSLKEALPIAVLEAMSVGLPVVATQVGGVPEVVADGVTGSVIPPSDVAALHNTLERLVANPILRARLGSAGQAHIHANFTLDRMVGRVESLYEELARRKLTRVTSDE